MNGRLNARRRSQNASVPIFAGFEFHYAEVSAEFSACHTPTRSTCVLNSIQNSGGDISVNRIATLPSPFGRLLLVIGVVLGTAPAASPDLRVEQPSGSSRIGDVRLAAENSVTLRLVDASGQPVAGQPVRISFNRQTVARAGSDAKGRVTITKLRTGIHVVTVADTASVYRFWTAETAPPNALRHPAVVLPGKQIRGQYTPAPMVGPVLIGTGIAATALVVVLVGKSSASNNQPSPSSPSSTGSSTSSTSDSSSPASP